jgi:hypothetical protein
MVFEVASSVAGPYTLQALCWASVTRRDELTRAIVVRFSGLGWLSGLLVSGTFGGFAVKRFVDALALHFGAYANAAR